MTWRKFCLIALSTFLLEGCAGWKEKIPSWNDLAFWKDPPPPAVVPEQWCYETLGEIDCYPQPQNTLPERLSGVSPRSRQPTSRDAHGQALLDAERAQSVKKQ